MLRITRPTTLGYRLLSLTSKFHKPFDFTNINANKPNELFDLDNILARGKAKEGSPSNSILFSEPKKNVSENNRFANMFERGNNPGLNKNSRKPKNFDEANGAEHFNKTHNKKHRTQKLNDRRGLSSESKKSARKALRFQIETGSDQAQNAIKDIISKVHNVSKTYRVKFVNPETNKLEQKHLVEIVNNTDLAEKGLFMVPASKEGELPLIKTNKVYEMIKLYTDELAFQREKELLEKGSIAAQKAVRQRDKAEKKKSATKILTLSWKISMSDLNNQKKMEIKRRISKGEKFILYIGDRRSLYAARKSVDKEGGIVENMKEKSNDKETENLEEVEDMGDPSEIDFEIKRRHMILEELENILTECDCQFDTSGHIDSRIMVSCSPAVVLAQTTSVLEESDLSSKELKRQKKLEKQKKIEEEKKLKKLRADEDELDSLYLFRIEE